MPDPAHLSTIRGQVEAALATAMFECGEELRAEGAKFGTATALLGEVARRVAHGETVAALLDVAEAAQELIDCVDERPSLEWIAYASSLNDALTQLNLSANPQGEPE